ncbi:protein-tyrosine phosphatase 1 [Pelomyxa schiedti]|nr:protein-tyrosine phosphatase 1 [Pelomyxa schiedti]
MSATLGDDVDGQENQQTHKNSTPTNDTTAPPPGLTASTPSASADTLPVTVSNSVSPSLSPSPPLASPTTSPYHQPPPPPMPDISLEVTQDDADKFLEMQRRQHMQQHQRMIQFAMLQQQQPTSPTTSHAFTDSLPPIPSTMESVMQGPEQRLLSWLDPLRPYREFSALELDPTTKSGPGLQSVSLRDCNKLKNRYANVVPYDSTRVKLDVLNVDGSDYINASFVSTNFDPDTAAYIATQGPLPETFADFWKMTWETRCPLIVMLTREREQSMVKVDRYWPLDPESDCTYGSIKVHLLSREDVPNEAITRRRFQLTHISHPEDVRIVEHYQYSGWPDHNIPGTTEHIRTLIHRMSATSIQTEEARQSSVTLPKPTIVHCSAGIGRTGTFCAIHANLEVLYAYCKNHPVFGHSFKTTGKVRNCAIPESPTVSTQLLDAALEVLDSRIDIPRTVQHLRRRRPGMVQQQEQYSFCYFAVQDEMVRLGLLPCSVYEQLVQLRLEKGAPRPPELGSP